MVDKAGNAVAVTYTLNTNFGSGIVAKGTGILLNNEMDDFAAKPGVANAYGLVGGDANAVAAKKRPLSSMTPTLVLKDGKPTLVTGQPPAAPASSPPALQTVVNTIDLATTPPKPLQPPACTTSGRLMSCAWKRASRPTPWPCSSSVATTSQ